jgi:hypothetical protein
MEELRRRMWMERFNGTCALSSMEVVLLPCCGIGMVWVIAGAPHLAHEGDEGRHGALVGLKQVGVGLAEQLAQLLIQLLAEPLLRFEAGSVLVSERECMCVRVRVRGKAKGSARVMCL